MMCMFRYGSIKQRLDIKRHEVNNVETRLRQTTHHQLKTEVEQLQASLGNTWIVTLIKFIKSRGVIYIFKSV